MKLFKIFAVSALAMSSSLLSQGTEPEVSPLNLEVAAPCSNWPFCRDVDFADQALESTIQVHLKLEVNKMA
jgi:hypothetical protein